jgi:hypothetical protein
MVALIFRSGIFEVVLVFVVLVFVVLATGLLCKALDVTSTGFPFPVQKGVFVLSLMVVLVERTNTHFHYSVFAYAQMLHSSLTLRS